MSSPKSFYIPFDHKQDYPLHDCETQTSKTILQLAADELSTFEKSRSPSPLKFSPRIKSPCKVIDTIESPTKPIVNTASPRKQRRAFLNQTSPFKKPNKFKKRIDDKTTFEKIDSEGTTIIYESNQWNKSSQESQEEFDLNDILAKLVSNENVSIPELSQYIIASINIKIVPKNNRESPSSVENHSENEEKTKMPDYKNYNKPTPVQSETEDDKDCQEFEIDPNQINVINNLVANLKHPMWNTQLEALQEITSLSHNYPTDMFIPHMPVINQAVIHLLQSPRSAVCRTCCKIAGELFTTITFVHRPEFDDVVEILLNKTADVNRFIKTDANHALDAMVANFTPFHAIRVLFKGTKHKNDLVRIAASRLLLQIVSVCGPDLVLASNGNEFTRKRILTAMVNSRTDKNITVRQNGEKLYTILNYHPNFEMFMKKLSDSKFHSRRKIEL